MSILFRLASGDQVRMNKQKFLDFFGDTILGQAVQLQPDLEMIDIAQPEITLAMLEELKMVTESTEDLPYVPNLKNGWKYLGGTLIPVISHPAYLKTGIGSFLYPERLHEYYEYLMFHADVLPELPELATYLGSRLSPADTKETDTYIFQSDWDVSELGGPKIIRYFLQRGVPPPNDFLIRLIRYGDPDLFRLALQYPQVDLKTFFDVFTWGYDR